MDGPRGQYRARALAAGLALLVGAAGHFHGDRFYLNGMNRPSAPPSPAEPAPEPPRPPRVARRLVVLFIDGLDPALSPALPALSALAARGVTRPLVPDFPSFTHPALVTLATGRPPRYSGVRINAGGPYPTWDTVSARAAKAGVAVLVQDGGFAPFGPLLTLSSGTGTVTSAEPGGRALVWIYLGEVDQAGHLHGGRSPEYRAAAQEADGRLASVVGALDLTQDAVVVVSDHAHLPRGGHGGVEPEVMRAVFVAAGPPFARGLELPPAPMENLAPTLAWALGLPVPRDSMGAPMADALGLAPPQEDNRAWAREAAARARVEEQAAARLPLGLALALALLLLAFVLHRRRTLHLRTADLLPSLLYLVGFFVPYFVAAYRVSWSIPRGAPGFYLETLLFGILGAGLACWLPRHDRRVEQAWVAGLLFGAPYLLLAVYAGPAPAELGAPWSSYLVVLLATAQFYACLPLGVRALLPERRGGPRRAPR